MNLWMTILAQTDQPTNQNQSSPAAFFPIALMLGLVAFMFLSARSQKKREQRQRDQMHANLSKNDRVLTIGGVIGTIMQVKDSEVVLKVDESTNTKMTFVKSAIQRIFTNDETTEP